MKLRTELHVQNLLQTDPFGGLVFMGSCFSQNVGGRFKELGLLAEVNPFGVIFHPVPLCLALQRVIDHRPYSESDLYVHQNKFYSLAHHGSFSSTIKEELLERMNAAQDQLRESLENSKLLCLTLGTAWGYDFEGEIVGNCHQLPQKLFTKNLTGSNELAAELKSVLEALLRKFPNLKVVLTVSPVRHVKDGLVENSRSKAHLLAAVHEVAEELSEVFYFPAYELVIDDLRDYRFYKSDMIHPSEQAVDYVFSQFQSFAFDADEVFTKLQKFRAFRNHKVMSKEAADVSTHEELLQRKKEALLREFPMLNLD